MQHTNQFVDAIFSRQIKGATSRRAHLEVRRYAIRLNLMAVANEAHCCGNIVASLFLYGFLLPLWCFFYLSKLLF